MKQPDIGGAVEGPPGIREIQMGTFALYQTQQVSLVGWVWTPLNWGGQEVWVLIQGEYKPLGSQGSDGKLTAEKLEAVGSVMFATKDEFLAWVALQPEMQGKGARICVHTRTAGVVPADIFDQPDDQTVSASASPPATAAFSVVVANAGSWAYRWQAKGPGASAYTDLADGGYYSGSGTSMLTVTGPSTTMSGTQYQCVVREANGGSISVSAVAVLTVNP